MYDEFDFFCPFFFFFHFIVGAMGVNFLTLFLFLCVLFVATISPKAVIHVPPFIPLTLLIVAHKKGRLWFASFFFRSSSSFPVLFLFCVFMSALCGCFSRGSGPCSPLIRVSKLKGCNSALLNSLRLSTPARRLSLQFNLTDDTINSSVGQEGDSGADSHDV